MIKDVEDQINWINSKVESFPELKVELEDLKKELTSTSDALSNSQNILILDKRLSDLFNQFNQFLNKIDNMMEYSNSDKPIIKNSITIIYAILIGITIINLIFLLIGIGFWNLDVSKKKRRIPIPKP